LYEKVTYENHAILFEVKDTYIYLFILVDLHMQGELQYFIGVQLDGTHYLEPERRRLSQKTESEGAKVVQKTADNIDGALRELPDANMVLLITLTRCFFLFMINQIGTSFSLSFNLNP